MVSGEVLDHDWVEWFVDRVRSWPSDVAVRVTLEAAADVGFSSDLKRQLLASVIGPVAGFGE